MVATDTAYVHTLVFVFPFVNRQQNKFFMNTPRIGNSIHKTIVYNVPTFSIVLLFLLKNLKDYRAALSHRIFSEFSVNIRFLDFFFSARFLYILDNFANNVIVIIFKSQMIPNRQTTTQVKTIKAITLFFQLNIHLQRFLELAPIIQTSQNEKELGVENASLLC